LESRKYTCKKCNCHELLGSTIKHSHYNCYLLGCTNYFTPHSVTHGAFTACCCLDGHEQVADVLDVSPKLPLTNTTVPEYVTAMTTLQTCIRRQPVPISDGLPTNPKNFRGFPQSPQLNASIILEKDQPPIQWVTGALSPAVKRPRREAHHSTPSNAEVKNAWRYTSTPPVHLHGVVLS